LTRVLVVGAAGRVGTHVLRAVEAADTFSVGAALDRADHPDLGREISPGVTLSADLGSAVAACDVAVDFSVPASTLALVGEASTAGLPVVSGTTGCSAEQQARIEAASRSIPIVQAGNFSMGITVLLDLVAEAARRLEAYEIEVLELHHNRKIDAPSGTALALARSVADARGVALADRAVYHREGQTGARTPDEIGLQALRMGDVVGEHTVYIAGPGERVELSHRAMSRDNFAGGALRAAAWVIGKLPALYSMKDVIT
jgi:4-hydroxy-tetrahydrodipicolinate reductase